MNIRPKTDQELHLMREGGKRLSAILEKTYAFVSAGQTLIDIDRFIHTEIIKQGGKPSFLGYRGYPASSCLSVNDVVVHGIPDHSVLKKGDVLSFDIGFYYEGYHTDAAVTKVIGEPTKEQQKLLTVTQGALKVGVETAVAGNNVEDIGVAIETYVNEQGKFGIVRDLTGHGIGQNLQEPPEVANYKLRNIMELQNNITLAIEPMITLGTWEVTVDDDTWTVRSKDNSLAAHFETTIAVHDNDPIVLVPFPLEVK